MWRVSRAIVLLFKEAAQPSLVLVVAETLRAMGVIEEINLPNICRDWGFVVDSANLRSIVQTDFELNRAFKQ